MKLEKVTGRPFVIFCISCGQRKWAGDVDYVDPYLRTASPSPVYADLEGEPFKAYYCAECAKPRINTGEIDS
jgi:hypothetical protein